MICQQEVIVLSIIKRMVLFIFLPSMIAIAILGSAAYWLSRDVVLDIGRKSILNNTQSGIAQLDKNFNSMENIVMEVSDVLISMPNMDKGLLKTMLIDMAERTKMLSVYVGYADRSAVFSDNDPVPPDYDATKRGWFEDASKLKAGEFAYSEAYVDAINGKTVVTVSTPIYQNGKLYAVSAIDVELQALQALMAKMKPSDNGYGTLVDALGNFVYHPSYKADENIKAVTNGALKNVYEKMNSAAEGSVLQQIENDTMYFSYKFPGAKWVFYLTVPVGDFYKEVTSIRNSSIVIGIVAALLLAALILSFVKRVTTTISLLENQASAIADGDLSQVNTSAKDQDERSKDEFKRISATFVRMANSLRQLVSQTKDTSEHLVESSNIVSVNAHQMTDAAQHVAEITIDIAEKSNQQTKEVTTAQEQISVISSEIVQVKTNSSDAVTLADESSEAIIKGQDALKALVDKVKNIGTATNDVETGITRISNSSEKVKEIIEMVMQIAGQTNLLALNAAIEAARAGEHGRGFAVVAEEVRKLAEQSEQAAQQVTVLINANNADIVEAVNAIAKARPEVEAGMTIAGEADDTFEQIKSAINDIVVKIREVDDISTLLDQNKDVIVVAMEKIGESSELIAQNTMNVSAAAQEQLASVEEIAASNKALNELAENMQNSVDAFKV